MIKSDQSSACQANAADENADQVVKIGIIHPHPLWAERPSKGSLLVLSRIKEGDDKSLSRTIPSLSEQANLAVMRDTTPYRGFHPRSGEPLR